MSAINASQARRGPAGLAVLGSCMLVSALLVTGCGSSPVGTDEQSFGRPTGCGKTLSVDDMLKYASPRAHHDYKVALMEPSLQGYYFQAMTYGAKQAAKDAGIQLSVFGAQGYTDPSQQLTDAQNIINRGVDAIVLAPVDFNGSVPIADLAEQHHIPLVNISTEVNANSAYKVLMDDYTQGVTSAKQLLSALPKGGTGIVMGGPADASWSRRRVEGFKSILAQHPQFKIGTLTNTNGYPDEGLKALENAIQAHPNPDWVYSVSVYALLPASIPGNLKDVPYFTSGYDPMVADQLKSGGIAGSVSNDPVAMGKVGIGTAVSVLDGDHASKGTTCLAVTPLTKAEVGTPVTRLELIPQDAANE